jgi:hypothetical protein
MRDSAAVADEKRPALLEAPVEVHDGPPGLDAIRRLQDETAQAWHLSFDFMI